MDIWFDDPEKGYSFDEIGESIILKKNKDGKAIGIQNLNVTKALGTNAPVAIDILMV